MLCRLSWSSALLLGATVSHAQVVVIATASFGSRPGDLQNDGQTPSVRSNTSLQVSVPQGYSLSSTVDFTSGTFWKNVSVAQTSLRDIGFKLRNDAWPGFSTYVRPVTGTATLVTISALASRYLGPSGTSAWSDPVTLDTGAAIPTGSEWTIECYDDNDNDPSRTDAYGTGIIFSLPGTPDIGPVATATLPGTVAFCGSPGTEGNSVFTGLATVTRDSVMGSGVRLLGGSLQAALATSWASEARIRLTSSVAPTEPYDFQISPQNSPFSMLNVLSGSFRPWLSSSPLGLAIPSGASWQIEAYESYDDGSGPDAIGTGISFEILPGLPNPGQQRVSPMGTLQVSDAYPNAGNSFFTVTAQSSPVLANYAQFEGNYLRQAPDSWASDVLVAITNSGHPGRVAYLQPFPGVEVVDSLHEEGVRVLTGNLVGATIVGGTTYRIEFSDEVPNAADGEWEASLDDVGLTLYSSASPSSAYLSGHLSLRHSSLNFAFPRTLSYTLMKGSTIVASGNVEAFNSETDYVIALPSGVTGSAKIVWDGAAYLSKQTSLTLTGQSLVASVIELRNGDVDDSGEVDPIDLDLVAATFGQRGNIIFDADGSGEVDPIDLDVVISNFGAQDE